MAKSVIIVENLSKKYVLNHQKQERYTALRDVMANSIKRLGSRVIAPFFGNEVRDPTVEEFWALRDVSFEIKEGDRIGVIGRNGAGKSTLLKILSRITEPTGGRAVIKGRVASLLEVGTGFHPELTGRENIFLNGAVLGMSKVEIKKKFEEIVDFAEVEKFLDTPVKRYSSGMYVRLAFAVAAHLEPEILLVDEVLAVGDARFQKKCLGKMKDVGKEGRTVILVSHNMTSIQSLANKAVFLEAGTADGILPVPVAVNKYLHGDDLNNSGYFVARGNAKNKEAYIVEAKILNHTGAQSDRLETCESFFVEINWVNKTGVPVTPNFAFVNQNGVISLLALDTPADWSGQLKKQPGIYVSRAKIPANFLNAGNYIVSVALDCASPTVCYDSAGNAMQFTIWDPMDERCLARGNFMIPHDDVICWPALEWSWTREDIESMEGVQHGYTRI